MSRWIASCVVAALAAGCSTPHARLTNGDPGQPPSPSEAAPAGSASAAAPPSNEPRGAPPGGPVLVRLLVLDTNESAPAPLPDDRSLLRGALAELDAVARCRASTGSKAHWVEIEWRVDDAGKVLGVVAHPVFIPPPGSPPVIAPATLRCIEQAVVTPAFTPALGRPPARVFALVGFDLPDVALGSSAPGLDVGPELDGHCRRREDCPPTKHCEAPPRVPCPRADVAADGAVLTE